MSAKISDLIAYLLNNVPSVGRTQVVKFLYLADLEARKCLGKPLTDLNYVLDRHGPFDPKILAQLDAMDADGRVTAEQFSFRGNQCYNYAKNQKTPRVVFSAEAEVILDHVVDLVRKHSLSKLLEIVYDTEPVVDAKARNAFGKPLKMNLVNNARKIPGLDLERVLRATKDLDDGKGRSLEKVLAELDA
jgi:Protein of unknown function (DUF4065)